MGGHELRIHAHGVDDGDARNDLLNDTPKS